MPRLSEGFLRQVVFLYPTRDAALRHAKLGGTGLMVGRRFSSGEGLYVPYLVSNRHVVWDAGCSVIRVNRKDGSVDVFETDPSEWVAHSEHEDLVAIYAAFYNRDQHDTSFCNVDDFVTQEIIRDYDIGIGEEVFMIGRFLNHQGSIINAPAVRFGCISVMLEEIPNYALNTRKLSFAVEMRSRTGFSGSPVHVYRNYTTVLEKQYLAKPSFHYLLGVNWGYVLDRDLITGETENTWLNGVVPAWHVRNLLDSPTLVKNQEYLEQCFARASENEKVEGIHLAVAMQPKET